jgi:hypothetical protein
MASMSRFEVSGYVVHCELAGEAVLLDTQAGLYFGLDEIGTTIWSMVSSGRTEAEICDCIAAEYEVGRARLESDVRRLLADLSKRRLIVPIS